MSGAPASLTVVGLGISAPAQVTQETRACLERADEVMSDYRGTHMIADVGHWIQQEAPTETNRLLIDFLIGLR